MTRPNILWLISEDTSPDLGCYGAPAVATPHMDRIAEEGARFTQCFVTAPVCSASRSCLMTGHYQTSFGAQHHRSNRDVALPASVPLITQYFRQAGYFTCNASDSSFERAGKTDWNFQVEHPFDGTDWRQRNTDQPFFAQVNMGASHRMRHWQAGPLTIDPDDVELPPYYPDCRLTRLDWVSYLQGVQRVDAEIGRILVRLEEDGLADNTIVAVLSDHGRGHARDKQFCYDGGLRVPLLIRWPERSAAGEVNEQLVSGVDLAPTFLRLAGVELPEGLQGRDVLDEDMPEREFIVAARDRCDGTQDRIRCVRSKRFKYICNSFPERPYMQFNWYKKAFYPAWTLLEKMHRDGELSEEQDRFCQDTRPPEELYDLDADPHESVNVAQSNAHAGELETMRGRLARWTADHGDRADEPEDPGTVQAEREQMRTSMAETYTERGLDPSCSLDAYLAWWQEYYEKRAGNVA